MVKQREIELAKIAMSEVAGELQQLFVSITGLAIGFLSADGTWLPRDDIHISGFCKLIRSSPVGHERCLRACKADRVPGPLNDSFFVVCHAGLVNFNVPITIEGETLGIVAGGEVLLDQPNADSIHDMLQLTQDLGLDPNGLIYQFKQTRVVSSSELQEVRERVLMVIRHLSAFCTSVVRQYRLDEERRETQHLARELELAQLRTLHAQINRHFLFNALNTVGRLALIEGATQTEEMVYTLASLLRYALKNTDQLVPFGEEIKHLQHYLTIQKARFRDRLTVYVDIDPSLVDFPVPVLTLQPIVENAIVHGIEPRVDGGQVRVSARRVDGNALVEVVDNGIGIEPGILKDLLDSEQDGEIRSTGIGLSHTRKRLLHHFGPLLGFDIISEPEKGTTVRLLFPDSQL